MNRKEIELWLKQYKITNYIIHSDLVVDVNGSVDLSRQRLKKLPFQFGKVTGYFDCFDNNLTSMQYCPTHVGGDFVCDDNLLRGFDYFPKSVGGRVSCQGIVSDAVFETIPKNHNSWGELIASSKHVYRYLYRPTEDMTKLHKMLWEV